MTIVLTPEQEVEQEHYWINRLLEHGLECCHIRKYDLDEKGMRDYIDKISPCYRKQLVLHSHFHLAGEYGMTRVHFSEKARIDECHLIFQDNYLCSTSVHTMTDFNALGPEWSYAFLSPVYPSISKPGYGKGRGMLCEFPAKQNSQVKLIALGGVDVLNYSAVYRAGADGIALMGAVWQNDNPLNVFKQCRQRDQ